MMSKKPFTGTHRSSANSWRNTPECQECGHKYNRVGSEVLELVCENCDAVLEQPIRRNRAPIYSSHDETKLRTGGKVDPTRLNSGIGTSQVPDEIWRLDYNPHDNADESRLRTELSDVELFGQNLDLESYEIKTAKQLYRRARSAGLLQGRSSEGFIAICLLVSIRKSSRTVPVLIDDVLEQTPATREQFQSARSSLHRELGIEIEPLDPSDLLVQANRELHLPVKVERFAKSLLEEAQSGVVDLPPTPQTRAAVLLAIAFETLDVAQAPTQGEIAECLSVSQSVLSKHKNRFLESSM